MDGFDVSLYDEIMANVIAEAARTKEPWELRMHEWQRKRELEPGCICYCSADCSVHLPDPCICPPGEKLDSCFEHGTVKGWFLAREARGA